MVLQGGITNDPGSATTLRPLVNIAQRIQNPIETDRERDEAEAEQHRSHLPAKVVSFDPVYQTISAQVTVREKVVNPANGQATWQELPIIQDIPCFFPGGKTWCLDFTPETGEECLLLFGDTNIDSWFTSGGIQNYNLRRRHDLSDGFALVGFRSMPNALPGGTTDGIALRAVDGSGYVKLSTGSLVGDDNAGEFDPALLGFTQAEISGGGAKVEAKKTIKVRIVGGIPVPTIEPTLNFEANRFQFNGADFTP